jgi:glutathione S-transferase
MSYTIVIGNKNLSSWSLRPWLVMARCGVPFKEVVIRLNQPNTTKEIETYSAAGKVPVLIHEGVTIWESLAICEYLAEQFPEKNFWPKNSAARALARSVSCEMHAGFATLRKNMSMNVRARLPGEGHAPGVQEDIERICAIWRQCRGLAEQSGPFLFGEFSIADAFYAPVVTRFTTYAVPLEDTSQRYVETMLDLPEMKAWAEAAKVEE